MTLQQLKYAAFDRVTPEFLKDFYREHGRETANAESFSRLVIAPYLLFSAATDKKGKFPAAVRLTKMVLDGLDGYTAKQDLEYGTAVPTVKSAFEMTRKAASIAISATPPSEKVSEFIDLLHDADGGVIDPQFDKAAQLADQIGGRVNGDISNLYLASNFARIGWVDFGVRPTYLKLGVKSSSTPVSQVKTLVQDTQQTLESSGLLDRVPRARRAMSAASIGMTAWSAIDIMVTSERQYLSNIEADPREIGFAQIMINSTFRTLHHIAGIDIPKEPVVR